MTFFQPPISQLTLVLAFYISLFSIAQADANEQRNSTGSYIIQPGDVLGISAWKEEDLSLQVIVRPDGRINFPLVGEAQASGNTVENLRKLVTDKLRKYIPDPVVSIAVQELSGNIVYVIGKVNRPGEFQISRAVDVMQALSMAGGTSTYASLNNIKILRRENGKLTSIPFAYGEVEKGKNLQQNIILRAGDVVVVP